SIALAGRNNAGVGNTIKNTFIYAPTAFLKILLPTGDPTSGHSYNTWLAARKSGLVTASTGDFVYAGGLPSASTFFVDPSDAGENFAPVSSTVDHGLLGCTIGVNCLDDGAVLGAPYNYDVTGALRGSCATWERGAYALPTCATSFLR